MAARFALRRLPALAARAGHPASSQLAAAAPSRQFHSSPAVRMGKEYTGVGLETDPNTGVRIDKKAFYDFPGKPRSSEYESVLEQDPLGDVKGSGGNDDYYGETGLENHAPMISTGKAIGVFVVFWTSVYAFAKYLQANDHGRNLPVAPREGVWGEGKPNGRY